MQPPDVAVHDWPFLLLHAPAVSQVPPQRPATGSSMFFAGEQTCAAVSSQTPQSAFVQHASVQAPEPPVPPRPPVPAVAPPVPAVAPPVPAAPAVLPPAPPPRPAVPPVVPPAAPPAEPPVPAVAPPVEPPPCPPRPPLPAVADPPLEPPAGPSPPSGIGFETALPHPNPNDAARVKTTTADARKLFIERDSNSDARAPSAHSASPGDAE